MEELPFSRIVVHPLVLLSVVDHYTRVAKDTNKRVVGVLLGQIRKGVVDVMNSYAVPFEEEPGRTGTVWFFDHNFHENMYRMFRRVNAREAVVGWYSTGPKIRPSDIEINELMRRYTPNPVFVVIDVRPVDFLELPLQAYVAAEEVTDVCDVLRQWSGHPGIDGDFLQESAHGGGGRGQDRGPVSKMTFRHIASDVGTVDAEEVGVEHLLRDIQDTTVGTLAQRVNHKIHSLRAMEQKLKEMQSYLDNVQQGKLPMNQRILQQIQDIFNLIPNINVAEYTKAFAVKSNDMLLVMYLSSMVRAVIALHDLILNKMEYRDAEERKPVEDDKEKDEKVKDGEKGRSEENKDGKTTAEDSKKDSKPEHMQLDHPDEK